jgi:hypothetical protein
MKATTTDFTKRKVYISGKIAGLPRADVEKKFKESEEFLRELGYEPISPLNSGVPAGSTWEQYLAADILILLKCDAIFMQDDWEDSPGARLEYEVAYAAGKGLYDRAKTDR